MSPGRPTCATSRCSSGTRVPASLRRGGDYAFVFVAIGLVALVALVPFAILDLAAVDSFRWCEAGEIRVRVQQEFRDQEIT